MKKFMIFLSVPLLFTVIFAGLAFAQEDRLPQGGSFHVDLRALSLFNFSSMSLTHDDDPKDNESTAKTHFMLGTTGVGGKIGYLIGGYHDVGGYLLVGARNEKIVLEPDDDNLDNTEQRITATDFRLAAYYNYNWHAKGWLMPYVGPVLGFERTSYSWEDVDDSDSGSSTAVTRPFLGVEGGVKMFPFSHVAFDLGLLTTFGSAGRKTTFNDGDIDDDNWTGNSFDIGIHGGLNIYF